ncbi:hypothetical protein IEQ34_001687 [Dendrobium chrysotoxum]|uniref:RNase H type-1 domain-containing protein n=1 Tax=Dendrobium chrysotoxum TaxID=161865 RepID=A0AAV7H8K9_DENCH|nr:hypothetical protein IEQ34_001687 [Dendrobium chrysotoxum]
MEDIPRNGNGLLTHRGELEAYVEGFPTVMMEVFDVPSDTLLVAQPEMEPRQHVRSHVLDAPTDDEKANPREKINLHSNPLNQIRDGLMLVLNKKRIHTGTPFSPLGCLFPCVPPPPPLSWLKVNVDGALLQSNCGGIVLVLRDEDGKPLIAAGWGTQVPFQAFLRISHTLADWMFEKKCIIVEGDNASFKSTIIEIRSKSEAAHFLSSSRRRNGRGSAKDGPPSFLPLIVDRIHQSDVDPFEVFFDGVVEVESDVEERGTEDVDVVVLRIHVLKLRRFYASKRFLSEKNDFFVVVPRNSPHISTRHMGGSPAEESCADPAEIDEDPLVRVPKGQTSC